MPFTCNFYSVTDPPKTLYKTLGAVKATSACTPFEPVGDLTGKILIDYNAVVETCNYAAIGDRYYFIRDYIKDIGSRMQVILELDPLMTFKESIENCDIIVTRCSYQSGLEESFGYNSFLADPMVPIIQTTRHFSDHEENSLGVFENESYVGWNSNFFLVTVG